MKRIGLAVIVVIGVLTVIGLMLPRHVQVSRSSVMAAPPEKIYPYLADLKRFNEWSPWARIDPETKFTFSGPESGAGARMNWESKHQNVGSGTMEITEAVLNSQVRTALDFGEMGNSAFAPIHTRAEKRKGKAGLKRRLAPVAGNAALVSIGDDRILAEMTKAVFRAGFVWRVIADKWPGFEVAFHGFDPVHLAFMPDEEWDLIAGDTRIVRNPQKIRATRANATFVRDVSTDNDGFGSFLAQWPAGDQVGLMAHLAKHGSRLGGRTSQYFLRAVGWDGFILSHDVVACLRDWGIDLPPEPKAKRDLVRIREAFNARHDETGLPYVHLSRIAAMSVGENYDVEMLADRGIAMDQED